MSHASTSSMLSPASAAEASAPAARPAVARELSTPRHVAIAPEPFYSQPAGAVRGWMAALDACIEGCRLEGVEQLSVRVTAPGAPLEAWAANRELLRQLTTWIDTSAPRLMHSGVRFKLFGQATREIGELRAMLERISGHAANGRDARLCVNLGLGYDGRAELAEAARALARAPRASATTADALRPLIGSAELPPVDLLIRTGGQTRLTDFLLWQSAYAELLFVDAPWIGFDRERLAQALADYARRRRTFGGLEKRMQ